MQVCEDSLIQTNKAKPLYCSIARKLAAVSPQVRSTSPAISLGVTFAHAHCALITTYSVAPLIPSSFSVFQPGRLVEKEKPSRWPPQSKPSMRRSGATRCWTTSAQHVCWIALHTFDSTSSSSSTYSHESSQSKGPSIWLEPDASIEDNPSRIHNS